MIGRVSVVDSGRIDLFFNVIDLFFTIIFEFTAQDEQKNKQKNQGESHGSKVQNQLNLSTLTDFHEY